MRRIILSLIFLCWFVLLYGQRVTYQKNLTTALSKSATSHKLVLFIIPPSILPGYHDIPNALDSPAVAHFFNEHFISCKYNELDTAAASLLKTYPINVFPAYMFLDSNKNLVYKQLGASLMPGLYHDMGQKAINIYSSGRTLTSYNARYAGGNRDIPFLKDYISLREELGLMDNAQLIEEYASLLTVTALQDYQQVLFILKAGPYLWGNAYKLCCDHKKIIDSIYKTETPAVTSAINNIMYANTLNQAIATKNMIVTEEIASNEQSKWVHDVNKGRMVYLKTMLNYYKAINDTASFYPLAAALFDTYYMKISADSAKKILSKQVDPLLDYAKKSKLDTGKIKIVIRDQKQAKHTDKAATNIKGISMVVRPVSPPFPGNVANELNNMAYDFYTLGTHNLTYLAKAMLWSKRSIALNPNYYSYDTLAHLLYRLDFFDEAESTQNKAIALAGNATAKELQDLKTTLNKIKTKQL